MKGHYTEVFVAGSSRANCIIATVALANLTNRITDGLGLELEMPPEKI